MGFGIHTFSPILTQLIGSLLFFFAFQTMAHAPGARWVPRGTDHRIVVGPSIAYASHLKTSSGMALGGDATFVFKQFGWVSAGLVVNASTGKIQDGISPYVEAGGWFLLNWGLGYHMMAASRKDIAHGGHLFVGLPWPLFTDRLDGTFLLLLEPYYRPGITWLSGATFTQQVGVLFKLSYGWNREDK